LFYPPPPRKPQAPPSGGASGNLFNVQANGNVGIGTTSPGSTLQVNGGEVWSTGSSPGYSFADRTLGNGSRWVWYADQNSQGFSAANLYSVSSGAARLTVVANTGNVGIGTTSPQALLNVSNSSAGGQVMITSLGGTNGVAGADFRTPYLGVNYDGYINTSWYGATVNSALVQGMTFQSPRDLANWGFNFASQGGTSRMFIDTGTGNVGIGTTSPYKTLSVQGDINFTGGLYQNGSIYSPSINKLTQNFTATTTISVGDVVSYLNNYAQKGFNVSANSYLSYGAASQFATTAKILYAARLDSTHFVLAYLDTNGTNAYAVVGSLDVSGNITFGAPYAFPADPSCNNNNCIGVAVLDSTHFVVGYMINSSGTYYPYYAVGTVSGVTVTGWGTPFNFGSNNSSALSLSLVGLDSTHFVSASWILTYYSATPNVLVFSVSGTTISNVGNWTSVSGTAIYNTANPSSLSLLAPLDSTHFVVVGDTSAQVVSYSGTTYTLGTANTFDASGTLGNVAFLDSTHFVVAYKNSSNYGTAKVASVSGTTISYGSANTYYNSTPNWVSITGIDSTHFAVAYADSNFAGSAIIGTISGTTISSYGTTKVFNPTGAPTYTTSVAVAGIDGNHIVAASGGGFYNTNYAGKAVIGSNLLVGGAPIGVANTSATNGQSTSIITSGIADVFSGLTPGSVYYAGSDGKATTTPTIFKLGIAISSTAIQLNQDTSNINQYFGDMIFANNFRITEDYNNHQGLLFKNQLSRDILGLNELGDLTVGNMLQAQNIGLGTSTPQALMHILSSDSSKPLQILQSAPSQIANFLDFKNNEGIILSAFNANGNLALGTSTATSNLFIQATNSISPLTIVNASGLELFNLSSVGNFNLASSSLASLGSLSLTGNLTALLGNSYLKNLQLIGDLTATSSRASFRDLLLSGNIGIGTTSPFAKLSIVGSGVGIEPGFVFADANGTQKFSILNNGNVGIGTTSPYNFKLQVAGNIGPDQSATYNLGSSGNNWECLYYDGGTLGTCASDINLKNNIQDLNFDSAQTDALSQVAGLHLRTFSYKNDPTGSIYHGLIAQEVESVAPELVATGNDGYKAVKYGDIQWLTVQALQQLNLNIRSISGDSDALASSTPVSQKFVVQFFQNLFSKIGEWLASATNGLTDVFANVFHAKQQICVDNQCLNADDVKNLLALVHNQNATTTAVVSATNGSITTSAGGESILSLIVTGNNPAQISVGDVYNDLGAKISQDSPVADQNLGIFANVDGGATTTPADISIDTKTAGSHTIVYSVTDATGFTATATRTVTVSAPSNNSTAANHSVASSTADTSVVSSNVSDTSNPTSDVTQSTTDTASTTSAI
jgi:hypothetical protein